MKIKSLITKNFRLFGVGGVVMSWLTIGTVWAGVAILPVVGFCLTGSLFGLAIIGLGR